MSTHTEIPAAISSARQYHTAMAEIERLIEKGFDNLNDQEVSRLDNLSDKVHEYESEKYPMPMANSISGILQGYMKANNINRTILGKELKISGSTISDIINEKKGISFPLAVKMHKILRIDAEKILNVDMVGSSSTQTSTRQPVQITKSNKARSPETKNLRRSGKKAAAKKKQVT